MIEGADLTIYDENGDNFTIGLSNTQLTICLKILGIQLSKDGQGYVMFSDSSLKKLTTMEGNPLHFKLMD